MKIAVISDLHLGVGDASDRFGHDQNRFLTFLQFLEDNFEKIVLLGDIWDPHTAPQRTGAKEGLRLCRESHLPISQRFEKPQYHYVHGNHDLAAAKLENAPGKLTIEAHGLRILFAHGHEHDVFLNRAPWLADFGVWLGAWLLRLGLSSVYSFFDHLDAVRSGVSSSAAACTFQKWAVTAARQHQADVIVTGHTHLPVRAEHDDVVFLNSGSCTKGRFNFAALDTAQNDFLIQHAWA